jgi:hypothetical protein
VLLDERRERDAPRASRLAPEREWICPSSRSPHASMSANIPGFKDAAANGPTPASPPQTHVTASASRCAQYRFRPDEQASS